MYGSKYNFSDNKNARKDYDFSFTAKYDKLIWIYHRLNEFRNLVPQKEKAKRKKENVHKNAANVYNTLLTIYFND